MYTDEKLLVLTKIAGELNRHHITWAVGASLLLYLKGKASTFQDIDLMVAESDIAKTRAILQSMGTMQPPNPHKQYKTRFFHEFVINGVDVDVMAGFTIVSDETDHYFPLRKEDIKERILLHDEQIPLQSLAEWREFYRLMGRTEKVRMIDE